MTVEEARAEASAARRACDEQNISAGDAATRTDRARFWEAEVERLSTGGRS